MTVTLMVGTTKMHIAKLLERDYLKTHVVNAREIFLDLTTFIEEDDG